MPRALPRTLRRTAVGSALLASLVAGLLAVPAAAAPGDDIPAANDCPASIPTSALTVGMTGTGLTVVKGASPQPFAVEIVGVLDDGIGAGRDMIIIEASDLPGRNVISAGGGIWAGMSGSPVYIDGKLLGAVSYGFSASPSPIGGVTPAADMLDLLGLPSSTAARKATAAKAAPAQVALSAAERKAIDARAAVAVPRGSLEVLPMPMSLSGLSAARVARFQAEADAGGLNAIAYAGSKSAVPTAAASAWPTAGGNFGAALSYGDLTTAAFGTTTAICGDEALAFGHPFNYAGPVNNGANDGSSLAIVKDNTFGSFKMANIGAPFGTVDQDRLAGIRADLTRTPALTPIRSTIRNLDTGVRRRGQTLAADRVQLPAITAYGLLASYDATFDEIGDGRASIDWTITGRRAGNKPFTLTRGNKFASFEDISAEAVSDPASAVEALLYNEFEPVKIDKVSVLSQISTDYRHLSISKMEVSVDGGKFSTPRVLRVKAGATLRIRVTLRPYQSTTLKTTTLTMKVPTTAKGRVGSLLVTGGAELAQGGDEEEGCLIAPELDSLLSDIAKDWRNDEVAGRLVLEPAEGGTTVLRKSTKKRQSDVVFGEKELTIEVR
jgi:SpoIVB peptidase S55